MQRLESFHFVDDENYMWIKRKKNSWKQSEYEIPMKPKTIDHVTATPKKSVSISTIATPFMFVITGIEPEHYDYIINTTWKL